MRQVRRIVKVIFLKKNELTWREVAFFISGMVLVFASFFAGFLYLQYSPLSVQGIMLTHDLHVRSTFNYSDSVTYKSDRWHIEDLNWTIYIYDSPSDLGVSGYQWGDYIFVRSGLMPTQIRSVCSHEGVHVLGGGEKLAYYLQWKVDIPACSYLANLAEEMFLKNQTQYHEVFG